MRPDERYPYRRIFVPIVHLPLMELPLTPDPLDAALASLRPRGAFLYRGEFAAPWGFSDDSGLAVFHIVERGTCCLTAGGETVRLDAGDLAVLPTGAEASFRDAPSTPAPPVAELVAQYPLDAANVLRNAGDGPRTVLVCGGIAFDDPVPHPVLSALPPVLVLPGAMRDETGWLANTLGFIVCESRSGRPAAATVMGYLGSVLFIQAIRAALQTQGVQGWLGAVSDAHVGPALAAIQLAPERPWTVESLGREGGLGRSAFASRFSAAVGESPMQHVARWRVYRAAGLLRDGALPVAEIGERVGYESEAAFSRAFRRWTGRTPTAVRRAG